MTVPAKSSRKVISGSGWSNPLSFDIYIESSSHIEVWADDVQLALGTDYTVAGVANPSGFEVTILSPSSYATVDTWVLLHVPPMTQGADLSVGGAFGLAFENSEDAIVRRMQAVNEKADRALKLPLTSAGDEDFEDRVPLGREDGAFVPGPSASDISGAQGYAAAAAASAAAAAAARVFAADRPKVIASAGQSNMTLHPEYSWIPSPNSQIWNFDGVTDLPGSTGTAFVPFDGATMGTAYSYTDAAARDNPDRMISLINVSRSATGIDHWLEGTGAPDMYASLKNNVEAALAVLGLTEIDEFLWWQGETAPYDNYVNDFATFMARLRAETWFPEHTPITVFGVSSLVANSGVTSMTQRIRECANNDPERIAFVNTAALPVEFWDPTAPAYIHLNATGYDVAGRLGYLASHRGRGQGRNATPWRVITKRHLEQRVSDAVLTDDAELRFFAKIGTYRIRCAVIGATVAAADFQWGFTGPTVSPVVSKANDMAASALTTENASLFTAAFWPTAQVLSMGSGVFRLDIDVLAVTTAEGEIVFQWAQNVSNAGTTSVYKGSYIEYMLVD